MLPSHRLIANSVFATRLLPCDIISGAKDWGLDSFKTPHAAFAAHCIVVAAKRRSNWLGHRSCLGFLLWELKKICEREGGKIETLEAGLLELEQQGLIDQPDRRDDGYIRLSKYFAGKCNIARLPPETDLKDF